MVIKMNSEPNRVIVRAVMSVFNHKTQRETNVTFEQEVDGLDDLIIENTKSELEVLCKILGQSTMVTKDPIFMVESLVVKILD